MADTGLKIVIGADLSNVANAMKTASTSVQKFGAEANKAFFKIEPGINQATAALSKIQPGINQAGQALTNVGRIAQDLPFGFIGIQNNLNPLLESFQRLRAETGSSKAALKALGSSLVGAGGLGLALSVVSSAFLIFGNSTRGAKKELEGFDKAVEDSNKKAGEEIARVQVLNAVITDTTRKQSDRSKASKELSDILKDLNINMSQEAILNGRVGEATKLATQAILERAKARAIENRIGELSGEQLQRDIKRKAAIDNLTKATANLNTQQQIQKQVIGGSTLGVGGNTLVATQKVIGLQKEIKNLDGETAKANKEIQDLIANITSADLNVDFKGGADKAVDVLKQRIAALKELQSLTGLDAKQQVELAQLEIKLVKRDAGKLGFTKAEAQQQIQGILEKAFPVGTFVFDTVVTTRVNSLEPSKIQTPKPLSEGQVQDIAKATGLETIEIPAPKITFTNLDQTTQAALSDLNQALNSIAQNIQVEAFATIGEAIGAALTGGNIGDVFLNFFSFLADGLKQFGKALIAYGVALLGFKLAIKSLNPAVALIAGVAAVAAGSLVKASLPKFADGGIVTGPVIGQIGEMHKPEVIMPLDRLKALIGSGINNGNGGLQMVPIINNEGLYLAVKRGGRTIDRKI